MRCGTGGTGLPEGGSAARARLRSGSEREEGKDREDVGSFLSRGSGSPTGSPTSSCVTLDPAVIAINDYAFGCASASDARRTAINFFATAPLGSQPSTHRKIVNNN
mmetsp:Transcript_44335/g.135091  ORF Transcript_44335/g.135091 Transcript_44335/m.135091 type:complete len:106 (-) Transcript_44335:74-391(-)